MSRILGRSIEAAVSAFDFDVITDVPPPPSRRPDPAPRTEPAPPQAQPSEHASAIRSS
jgi:hypothetical protein